MFLTGPWLYDMYIWSQWGSVMVDGCHFGLSQVRVTLFYGPVEAVLEMAYELNGSSS